MEHAIDTTFGRTETEFIIAAIVVVISSVVSTFGNGLVMLSYFNCPNLRSKPGSCFVVNLAVADFLCGVYVQIPCIFNLANPKLHFSGTLCVVHSVITWTIMTVSNWTLAAISADRAIAVNRPFKYPNWVTTFRVRCTIALFWLFSLILAVSVINIQLVSYHSWELMCTPTWMYEENLVPAFAAGLLCFWIPTGVLLLNNISIIYAVRHLKSVVASSCPGETGQPKFCVKDHTKSLRSFYLLVVVYFCCIVPYYQTKFNLIKIGETLSATTLVVFILLLFSASALNPFMYALLRKDHREAILKTIGLISAKAERIKSVIWKACQK